MLLVGRQNGAAILKVSLAVTYKTKPILSILLRDHGPCGDENGNPLQYSCLENPMNRGAWQAMVQRVSKSQTQLKQLSTHAWSSVLTQIS